MVCQDREVPDLAAGASGSVTIHNPDIGGLLPVFVRDSYEGFEVKTFGELTDDELDALPRAQRHRGARPGRRARAASTRRSPTTWSWPR